MPSARRAAGWATMCCEYIGSWGRFSQTSHVVFGLPQRLKSMGRNNKQIMGIAEHHVKLQKWQKAKISQQSPLARVTFIDISCLNLLCQITYGSVTTSGVNLRHRPLPKGWICFSSRDRTTVGIFSINYNGWWWGRKASWQFIAPCACLGKDHLEIFNPRSVQVIVLIALFISY